MSAGITFAMVASTSIAADFNYSEDTAEAIARSFVEMSVEDSPQLPTSAGTNRTHNLYVEGLVDGPVLYEFQYDANNPSGAELAAIDELNVTVKLSEISHTQNCNTVKEHAALSNNESSALTSFKCLGDDNLDFQTIAGSSAINGSERLIELKDVNLGYFTIVHNHSNVTSQTETIGRGVYGRTPSCDPSYASEANHNIVTTVTDSKITAGKATKYYLSCTETWDTYSYPTVHKDITFKIDHSITATPTNIAAPGELQEMTYELNSSTQIEWLSGTEKVWVPIQVGDITTFIETEVDVYSSANSATNFAISNPEVTTSRAGSDVMAELASYIPQTRSGESLMGVNMVSTTSLELGCSAYSMSLPFVPVASEIGDSLVGIGGVFSQIQRSSLDALIDQCDGQVNVFTKGLVTTDNSAGYLNVDTQTEIEESAYWSVYGDTLLNNLVEAKSVYQTYRDVLDGVGESEQVWQNQILAYSTDLKVTIRNKLLLDPARYLSGYPTDSIGLINYVNDLVDTLFVTEAESVDPDSIFYGGEAETWLGLFKPGSGNTPETVVVNPQWLMDMKSVDNVIALKADLIAYAFNNFGYDNLDSNRLILNGYASDLQNEMGKSGYFLGLADSKLLALNGEVSDLATMIAQMRDESVQGSVAAVLADAETLLIQ